MLTELGTTTVTLTGGVRMPLIGLGTWQLRGSAGYQAVSHALVTGYRHLDTATMYGNEGEVGQAVRDSPVAREDVFITTKLPPERTSRARQTLTDSLSALGTEYVDLWLIHWPPRARDWDAAWRELLAAREAGLARAVGVSNYSLREIDSLVRTTGQGPAVNQIPWSPWQHSAQRLEEHRERGIVLEGYSPFKRSDLRNKVLAEIAATHGMTAAQVILRWHIDHGFVAIPKSASPERIASNVDIFGFSLSPDELARIDALGR